MSHILISTSAQSLTVGFGGLIEQNYFGEFRIHVDVITKSQC